MPGDTFKHMERAIWNDFCTRQERGHITRFFHKQGAGQIEGLLQLP